MKRCESSLARSHSHSAVTCGPYSCASLLVSLSLPTTTSPSLAQATADDRDAELKALRDELARMRGPCVDYTISANWGKKEAPFFNG